MRANVKPKVLWAEAITSHALDLLHKFFGGFGDVGVPVDRIAGKMDTAEILEARPVAEPAAHLHEGVVHLRVAVHVADGQPLDGQASGEAQTTDRDRGQPDSFLRVAGVVEHLVTLAIDDIEVKMLEDATEGSLHLGPCDSNVGIFGIEGLLQALHVHVS